MSESEGESKLLIDWSDIAQKTAAAGVLGALTGLGIATWREQKKAYHVASVGTSWALIAGSYFATSALLSTTTSLPPRDVNLGSGLVIGGFYGLILGKNPRSMAAGMLVGSLTVMVGTIAGEELQEWRVNRALKIQDKKDREEKGIPPERPFAWVPKFPAWFPLQIVDLSKEKEKTEGDKMEIEILKLEKELKEREAKLRREDLERARMEASKREKGI